MHKPSGNYDEYKKEILKELHPLVMYYFDQIGGKDLKTVYVKAGNNILPGLIEEKYGFGIKQLNLRDTVMLDNSVNVTAEELDAHVPLAGLLLGRRLL